METIATVSVIAQGLWPNASDEFHRRDANRLMHVDLNRTERGEFYLNVRAHNPLAHTFTPRSNAFDNEAEARDAQAEVARFVEREWAGAFSGAEPPHCPPSWKRETLCPTCERFGTLTTVQEAWGDRTTCSACDYHRWYSIGD